MPCCPCFIDNKSKSDIDFSKNSEMDFMLHKQTSRYFANPFINNSSVSKLVTKEWLISKIKFVVEQLATNKISEDEFSDDGPYVGPSGIAYSLLRVSKSNIGINFTKEAPSILKKQQKLLPKVSKAHECRYLTGTLGFYTIQLIADEIDLPTFSSKVKKMVGLVLQPGYQKIGDDEILNGRSGFLNSILTIRKEKGLEVLSNDEICSVLNSIIQSGISYSQRHRSASPLMYQWHGDEYLGAAHGVSGILQTLLCFWNFLNDSSKIAVKQSVDWYLSIQMQDGNFPSGTDRIGKKEELIHWCHGATGVLHMLLAAHLIFKDTKYLQSAIRCANLIWERGILCKGPGICHGVAGSGYAFLLLYRQTNENEWLDKAKTFALIMMSEEFNNAARTPDNPFSLFEGWAGSLCFLIDLITPMKAQFPLLPLNFKN
ncbi:hypothetical protein Mgra_00007429 [Meloidogyne graminicola]|uniref:Uncharacterized protein n=1 Tax=Meloidogyne graminicola TaxID=189291 RepID=A0A8S9ZIQ5_9BILA|nr:hypothetical protein Mgra_00007429 [Meloidogyne graminicola]